MSTIRVKILSYRTAQRYTMRRTIQLALQCVQQNYPDVEIDVSEIREVDEILKITPVIISSSLVIEDQLVCTSRFPKKEEVIGWLEGAILAKELPAVAAIVNAINGG